MDFNVKIVKNLTILAKSPALHAGTYRVASDPIKSIQNVLIPMYIARPHANLAVIGDGICKELGQSG